MGYHAPPATVIIIAESNLSRNATPRKLAYSYSFPASLIGSAKPKWSERRRRRNKRGVGGDGDTRSGDGDGETRSGGKLSSINDDEAPRTPPQPPTGEACETRRGALILYKKSSQPPPLCRD